MIQSVETINGKKIPLQYVGKKTMGSDDGAVAVVAAVSIIGGLFMKGQNVTIAQGEIFDAEVTADTDLEVPLDGLADAMNPMTAHGVQITIK